MKKDHQLTTLSSQQKSPRISRSPENKLETTTGPTARLKEVYTVTDPSAPPVARYTPSVLKEEKSAFCFTFFQHFIQVLKFSRIQITRRGEKPLPHVFHFIPFNSPHRHRADDFVGRFPDELWFVRVRLPESEVGGWRFTHLYRDVRRTQTNAFLVCLREVPASTRTPHEAFSSDLLRQLSPR